MIQSRQIEAFRAVMLTGAMTTAASAIHVTQPAVSRLIRDLEQELGLTLFNRRGNLVVPTAEAQALLAEVERSFVGLRQIRDFAEDLRAGRGGSLRVAVLPAMGPYVARLVAGFSRDRPQLKIQLDSLPSSIIREHVIDGRYDIGVVDVPFRRDVLAVTPIEDRAVVVVPPDHRLAGRDVVRAADLDDEKLILLHRFTDGLHPIQAALQAVRRRQSIETHLCTIACVLVSEGMGVAIVDPFSASEFIGRNLVVRAFDPPLNIGTAIVHSNERPLPMIARAFQTLLIDHIRAFLERAAYLGEPTSHLLRERAHKAIPN